MDALTNNHLPGVWRSYTLDLSQWLYRTPYWRNLHGVSHVPDYAGPLVRQGYVVRRWDVSFNNRFTLTGADIDGTLVGA